MPKPKFLMIGHIHSDTDHNIENLSTYQLIEKFYNTKTVIYVNLGRTQLKHGYKFWKDTLSKVDILQLNIDEIKFFLNSEEKLTLKINIIITLDKLGAICISKAKDDIDFYAPEIPIWFFIY